MNIRFFVDDREVTLDRLKDIYDNLDWTINSYESLDLVSIKDGEIKFEISSNQCD